MTDISLSKKDLILIADAISWTLYLPFYRSTPPQFSKAERTRLEEIFEQLCYFLHMESAQSVMNSMQLTISGQVLTQSAAEINNLVFCLKGFYGEIGHSPEEISVVTGLSIDELESLIARLAQVGFSN